jgi:BTG family
MLVEVEHASNFLIRLLELGNCKLSQKEKDILKQEFINVMQRRYRHHWCVERPHKNEGYRCLRVNKALDPVLVQACYNCYIKPKKVYSALPKLQMWINPFSVTYQVGENGSVCVLYQHPSI